MSLDRWIGGRKPGLELSIIANSRVARFVLLPLEVDYELALA
jgi:hypothetical protein